MDKYTKNEKKLIKLALDFRLNDGRYDVRYRKYPDGILVIATKYMTIWLEHQPFNPECMSKHEEITDDQYERVLKEPDLFSQDGMVTDMQTIRIMGNMKYHVFARGSKLEKEILIDEGMLRKIPYNPEEDSVYVAELDKDCPVSFCDKNHSRYALIAPLRTDREED